jgi:hypothetical protein
MQRLYWYRFMVSVRVWLTEDREEDFMVGVNVKLYTLSNFDNLQPPKMLSAALILLGSTVTARQAGTTVDVA